MATKKVEQPKKTAPKQMHKPEHKEQAKEQQAEQPASNIVQPKKDEHMTQEAAKANAQKGEPIHTPHGDEVARHGINVELGEK